MQVLVKITNEPSRKTVLTVRFETLSQAQVCSSLPAFNACKKPWLLLLIEDNSGSKDKWRLQGEISHAPAVCVCVCVCARAGSGVAAHAPSRPKPPLEGWLIFQSSGAGRQQALLLNIFSIVLIFCLYWSQGAWLIRSVEHAVSTLKHVSATSEWWQAEGCLWEVVGEHGCSLSTSLVFNVSRVFAATNRTLCQTPRRYKTHNSPCLMGKQTARSI